MERDTGDRDTGDSRETIWGIDPKDRAWFQLLTLIGGVAGSVILTTLELASTPPDAASGEIARNVVLGIGASFVASGFIAWGLLQAKELIMSIAKWINDATERRRKRLREEGRREGYSDGVREGYSEGVGEGYSMGYSDAQEGNPPQPPGARLQETERPSRDDSTTDSQRD